jgi:hypothetical protein
METVLLSVQDSSTVCAKRTIGADRMCPMVLLGHEAQVQAHFGQFGDSANLDARRCTICDERTIGSEISLDAPDGTSR